MRAPLEGYRVLEWTGWIAGPLTGMMLGDMGADVIKIEHRQSGDPMRGMVQTIGKVGALGKMDQRNIYFEHCNRNKKSITLDLLKPEGTQIAYELVKKSDVFLQNFRKGVAERLNLDYATLSKINPKLVYASISGWGPKGPDKDRPSFDFTGLARSGLGMSGGEEGAPPYFNVGSLADHIGGIIGANAVTNGLLMRERWGIGQEVEASMFGAAMFLQANLFDMELLGGFPAPKHSRARPHNPLWNYYKCKDATWIGLALIQADRQWKDLCQALGQPDLVNDPRFSNMIIRNQNNAEMVSVLDKVFSSKTRAEWMGILTKYEDLVCEPFNSISDVIKDPQAWANDYLIEFEHPAYGKTKTIGFPMHFSQAESKIRMPAPEFGQHTEEVLHELLDYSWEKIEELRGKEII